MIELLPGLAIGSLEDCRRATAEWSVVHACKFPCHHGRCGQPKRGERHFFSDETPGELFLNIIDPPTPLFSIEVFDAFLGFARREWLSGKKLLIHCNKGHSRAPSLALLFAAKVLRTISNRSFDDAWDEFSNLYPTPTSLSDVWQSYEPGTGIEEWLRLHWFDMAANPVGYIRGVLPTAPVEGRIEPPEMANLTEEASLNLVRGSAITHFAGFVTIEDKSHERIKPKPNILQIRIAEAYEWCLLEAIPPRIMVLKPRQVGSSTFTGELCYHHGRRFRCDGMILGDEASRTEKVWQIFCEYADHDTFPWDSAVRYNTEKARFLYADGSEGLWEHDTANDPKAGISGTRQVIWYTEAARYAKTGVRTDYKVITASLNSLAKVPYSLAVAESTADGAAGWFYDNWQEAVTLEQCRNGDFGNGWIKVFAAWFEFVEHRLARRPNTEKYFRGELSKREVRGIELYGWDAEQIAWRRSQIANECGNDERTFDQDFPENDIDCFLSSGRPRFDLDGMARLEKLAKIGHGMAELGVLHKEGRFVSFIPQQDGAYIWMRERPRAGCSYVASIDPCTGEQSKGARNPDAHAAGIIRAGYVDEHKQVHPPKLVAAVYVPNGCRWDASKIAEKLTHLADYFGGCMIVPETGNGLGVLVKLQDYGANIYRREKMDADIPGQYHQVLGWETNGATRDVWVNAVADGVREQDKGLDCEFAPAVKELRTFVINDRGKAEAKPGCHDDWVTMLGLGLCNLRYASVYRDIASSSASTWRDPSKEHSQFS